MNNVKNITKMLATLLVIKWYLEEHLKQINEQSEEYARHMDKADIKAAYAILKKIKSSLANPD